MDYVGLKTQGIQRKENNVLLVDSIKENINNVIEHGKFILGPEVEELENKLTNFTKAKHCITCSSGTDALLLSLMAIGIMEGDEIITTPFSFIATTEMILLLGAIPVFVDIDEGTYNINVNKIEDSITEKTKAILAVSLYGQTSNFTEINKIAKNYNLYVIEDGAQSFGALHNNNRSCNLTDIGTTSFFPTKPLGCYGDGGACFTNNSILANKIRSLSKHGQVKRYIHDLVGINGRMDTIQAAILLAKWEIYIKEIKLREKVAAIYTRKLNKLGILSTPKIENNNKSVYAQYTIQLENRDKVKEILLKEGIPTAVHYPKTLVRQNSIERVFKNIKDVTLPNCKIAQEISQRVLSIPMHPYLKEEEQEKIVSRIKIAIDKSQK